jgi:hypothetical protein
MKLPIKHGPWIVCLAASLSGGCSELGSDASTQKGAALKAQAFFDALVKEDWETAYSQLELASQGRFSRSTFERMAKVHREELGLVPDKVRMLSCREEGKTALAHVLWMGKADNRSRSTKDSIALQLSEQGWGVVLTPRFGKSRGQSED